MKSGPLSFLPPFSVDSQLTKGPGGSGKSHDQAKHLPGLPRVSLSNKHELCDFLELELCSDDLDRISNRLWWMSKQDSANISPLHRQLVKGRSIIVTEDPKLHLVWIYDRIFIKPLPRYLTSYWFWEDILCAGNDSKGREVRIRGAALGLLRTYHHLIKHESDFRMAQDPSLYLIPPEVTWEQFCSFARNLEFIQDGDVSLRYAYGEIRLTRLNFYAPFLLGKSYFQRVEYQYGQYFARFYLPILFVMGVLSVILGGLQIVAAAADKDGSSQWPVTMAVAISGIAIVASFCLFMFLGVLLMYKIVKEWRFALYDRYRLLEQGQGRSA
ncbi:hypothetical protein QQS21_000162 [Conoideocrella luteorostrata]|uniref:Subtilisin-like serine protease n=1 Tax=Conoideocrella luteorostrata TaxID=1105319 RepID=A0AAJ0D1G6_9HYPO|nr:hypothetical protein QQS21_000162 [Conoideocrella luteorostrata]